MARKPSIDRQRAVTFRCSRAEIDVLAEAIDKLGRGTYVDPLSARISVRVIRDLVATYRMQFPIRGLRMCRRCGCTAGTACSTPLGPCSWVEKDLCSGCLSRTERRRWLDGDKNPSKGRP